MQENLQVIVISFFVSLLLTRVLIYVSFRYDFLNRPVEIRISNDEKPLLGGVGIALSFFLTFIIFGEVDDDLFFILLLFLAILIFGVIDDKVYMGSKAKFVAPLIISSLMVLSGVITNFLPFYYLNFIFTLFFIYGLVNAYNFIDNMDGISSGIAAISSLSFGIFSVKTGQDNLAILCFSLFGATIGFLIYNFPPARIYAGDGGSLFYGLTLSTVAIYGTWGTIEDGYKDSINLILIPIFLVGYPIFDVTYVVFSRISNKYSPWLGDTNHSTHKLKKLGFSDKKVVAIVYLISFVLCVLAFITYEATVIDSVLIFSVAVSVLIAFSLILNRIPFELPSNFSRNDK